MRSRPGCRGPAHTVRATQQRLGPRNRQADRDEALTVDASRVSVVIAAEPDRPVEGRAEASCG